MLYKDNPFYILEVAPQDNRRKIISQAEEKSFDLEEKICNEAQSILLNPQKRINAELCWYLNNYDDIVNDTKICDFDSLIFEINNIPKINIENDELENKILTVSNLFDKIDWNSVYYQININRKKSSFVEVNDEEFQNGKIYLSEFIMNMLKNKIELISEKDIVILFSNLIDRSITVTNKKFNEYYNGQMNLFSSLQGYEVIEFNNETIIYELIQFYKLKIYDKIINKYENIKQLLTKTNTNIKSNTIDNYIYLFNDFKFYSKPILFTDSFSDISQYDLDLGERFREFAIILNNKFKEVKKSYEVITYLCNNYRYNYEFIQKLASDFFQIRSNVENSTVTLNNFNCRIGCGPFDLVVLIIYELIKLIKYIYELINKKEYVDLKFDTKLKYNVYKDWNYCDQNMINKIIIDLNK